MDRDKALQVIRDHVSNENIIKHMLATEVVMRGLSRRLEPEKERFWAIAGLLHDGDYSEEVPPEKQGIQISEWVESTGIYLTKEIKHSMAAHNPVTGVKPESKMAWALFACDSLTGLIVASALVSPNKKLADLKVQSVINRFNEPSFAKGTRREDILTCERELGLSLDDFVKISLQAMKDIADKLDL